METGVFLVAWSWKEASFHDTLLDSPTYGSWSAISLLNVLFSPLLTPQAQSPPLPPPPPRSPPPSPPHPPHPRTHHEPQPPPPAAVIPPTPATSGAPSPALSPSLASSLASWVWRLRPRRSIVFVGRGDRTRCGGERTRCSGERLRRGGERTRRGRQQRSRRSRGRTAKTPSKALFGRNFSRNDGTEVGCDYDPA